MSQQLNNTNQALMIYASTQTYTSTVFEHLDAFRKYSELSWSYLDYNIFNNKADVLDDYDIIMVHYTVRLALGQLKEHVITKLHNFQGLKALFIQDEYDNTNFVKKIIGDARFNLVFTVVPENSISKIYPSNEFPQTRFVNCLTGYVPDNLVNTVGSISPPSKRSLFIAYRGRQLSLRYGKLGQEKIEIGKFVKNYCIEERISCDIEWREAHRIYGEDWYKFLASAKAMLGSESGSNVFDWDGSLEQKIRKYQEKTPSASDSDTYDNIIKEREVHGMMNQISPRIFEMAASKTAMVLFEGRYSDVLEPHNHFLPLRKDFSNLESILDELRDDYKLDAMVDRAYQDIILSEKYCYQKFVAMVDDEIGRVFLNMRKSNIGIKPLRRPSAKVTSFPQYLRFPLSMVPNGVLMRFVFGNLVYPLISAIWKRLPKSLRYYIISRFFS